MGNFNKRKKYHFIYKTTCLLNGNYYIGMHSTNNMSDGYLGSGKRLKYSINKYGEENFKLDVLEFVETRELLIEREREIINIELLNDPFCLNLQEGGVSGFDYINKLRSIDVEYDMKWRILQSERMKKQHNDGKIKYNTFEGRFHSEASKQLMSEKKKNNSIGENNSQYGTRWITKDGLNKKIKKEDLDTYLIEGWCEGRK
jgi:group I intron endonuclease